MKAYIWDLDGTLLDSYAVITESLTETAHEYGVPVTLEEMAVLSKQDSVNACIRLIAEKSGKDAAEIKSRYSDISAEKKLDITLMPHAREALQLLSDMGREHFVFTHRGSTTMPVLENLGIAGFFREIITIQDGFARKPAPDAVLYLLEKYGLSASETAYVGDRTLDMECAANAGIPGILYLEADSPVKAGGAETCTVADLRDIAALKL